METSEFWLAVNAKCNYSPEKTCAIYHYHYLTFLFSLLCFSWNFPLKCSAVYFPNRFMTSCYDIIFSSQSNFDKNRKLLSSFSCIAISLYWNKLARNFFLFFIITECLSFWTVYVIPRWQKWKCSFCFCKKKEHQETQVLLRKHTVG